MNQAGQTFQYDALSDVPQYPGELPGEWAFQNLPNPARKEALPVQLMPSVFWFPTDEVVAVNEDPSFFAPVEQEWHEFQRKLLRAQMAATGTFNAAFLGPREVTTADVVDVLQDLATALQPNVQHIHEIRRDFQKIVHHLKRLF